MSNALENIIWLQNTDRLEYITMLEMQMIQCALFTYENLPETIPEHEIERLLFFNGSILFHELAGEYYVTKYVMEGDHDIYQLPKTVRPSTINKTWGRRVVNKDCIMIRNNIPRMATILLIKPYLEQIARAWGSKEIITLLSRVRYMFTGDSRLHGPVKAEFKRVLGSKEPIVFANVQNPLNELQKWDFDVDFDPHPYWEEIHMCFNRMFAIMGVNSSAQMDKRERLITDEIEADQEAVNMAYEEMLKLRRRAVADINKMFNLNITVNKKDNTTPTEDGEPLEEEEPVDDNISTDNEQHD